MTYKDVELVAAAVASQASRYDSPKRRGRGTPMQTQPAGASAITPRCSPGFSRTPARTRPTSSRAPRALGETGQEQQTCHQRLDWLPLSIEKAEAPRDRCRARVDTELGEDVLEMPPHRGRRDPEDLGDLGIRLAVSNPLENLVLTRGQTKLVTGSLDHRHCLERSHFGAKPSRKASTALQTTTSSTQEM
jgi:hypothetical protein